LVARRMEVSPSHTWTHTLNPPHPGVGEGWGEGSGSRVNVTVFGKCGTQHLVLWFIHSATYSICAAVRTERVEVRLAVVRQAHHDRLWLRGGIYEKQHLG